MFVVIPRLPRSAIKVFFEPSGRKNSSDFPELSKMILPWVHPLCNCERWRQIHQTFRRPRPEWNGIWTSLRKTVWARARFLNKKRRCMANTVNEWWLPLTDMPTSDGRWPSRAVQRRGMSHLSTLSSSESGRWTHLATLLDVILDGGHTIVRKNGSNEPSFDVRFRIGTRSYSYRSSS